MITREQVEEAREKYDRLKEEYTREEIHASLTKDRYTLDRLLEQGYFFFITIAGTVAVKKLDSSKIKYDYDEGLVYVDGYNLSYLYYSSVEAIGEVISRL